MSEGMQGRWRLPGAPRHGIGWQKELQEREERKRAAEESDRYAYVATADPASESRPAKKPRDSDGFAGTTSEATRQFSGELTLAKEVDRIHGAMRSGSDCMVVLGVLGRTPQLQDVRTQYRRLLLLLHADKRSPKEEQAAGGKTRCDEAFRAVRDAKKLAADRLRVRTAEPTSEPKPVFRPFYPTVEVTVEQAEQAAGMAQPPSPASSESSFERDPLFGKLPAAQPAPQAPAAADPIDAAVSYSLLQAVAAANDSAAAMQEPILISDGEDDEDDGPAPAPVGLDSGLAAQIMSLLGKLQEA
mmetsp:Transcript_26719/g.49028  ORF Transcript_26719/g.49028 Transcript_26719/m.49028 type:complete len:301 (-) Transcript_26719:45-947(-)